MIAGPPHTFSAMCVCPRCADRRQAVTAKARRTQREAFHAGQREAATVGRYAFHLQKGTHDDGRALLVSRSGATYERDQSGALRRIGVAKVDGQRAQILETERPRGKKERKQLKRERMRQRQALAQQQRRTGEPPPEART